MYVLQKFSISTIVHQWVKKTLFFSHHRESIISLKRKYLKSDMEDTLSISHANMDATLDIIAKEGCSSLLDEVFMDLEVRTYLLKNPEVFFIKEKIIQNEVVMEPFDC